MSELQLSFLDDPKADLPLRSKIKRYDADFVVTITWFEPDECLHLEVKCPDSSMSVRMERGKTVNDALARADAYIEGSNAAHEWHLLRAVARGDFEVFEHRGYEFKVYRFDESLHKCLASSPSAGYPFTVTWSWIERPGVSRDAVIAQARSNIDGHLDIESVADKAEWDAACKAGTINMQHYNKYWGRTPVEREATA